MSTSLWEINTPWIVKRVEDSYAIVFPYRSWADFMDNRPYHMWKPYSMTSWAWKDEQLQLVFTIITGNGHIYTNFAEFPVKSTDEPAIRAWIKKHMPAYWKI